MPTYDFDTIQTGNATFPKVQIEEQTAASVATPAAGKQNFFIDSADHKIKRKDSGGTVTDLEAAGSLALDDVTDVNAPSPADGDVLTYDSGSGDWINAAPGGGGGLTLLESHAAAASASLDFTAAISGAYDVYRFELVDVLPATDNVHLYLQVSFDGGSTWQTTTGDYAWTFMYSDSSPSVGSGGSGGFSTGAFGIVTGIDTGGSAGQIGVSGTLTLINPAAAQRHKITSDMTYHGNSGQFVRLWSQGYNTGATAVNAVRFIPSSGDIASGKIRCYGLAT